MKLETQIQSTQISSKEQNLEQNFTQNTQMDN